MKLCTSRYVSTCALRKCERQLCQNCVTYPPKPWGNTVVYGDTLKQLVVAEVVDRKVRW
jgi:hypothetical protein